MDGTAALFGPFVAELPQHVQTVTISYPADVALSYEQLTDRVRGELPVGKPYVIVAESYSGPIALQLAARPVGDLRAIVFVASFVARPLGVSGLCLARLPLTTVFRVRPPRWLLRWLLMEPDTPLDFVSAVRDAVSKVRPQVLAARMREALTVNRTNVAQSCSARVVCLTAEKDRLLRWRGEEGILRICYRADAVRISAPHLLLQCAPRAAVAAMSRLGLLEDTEAAS